MMKPLPSDSHWGPTKLYGHRDSRDYFEPLKKDLLSLGEFSYCNLNNNRGDTLKITRARLRCHIISEVLHKLYKI